MHRLNSQLTCCGITKAYPEITYSRYRLEVSKFLILLLPSHFIKTTNYDSVYLTCSKLSKKLTSSQLSLPHGIYKKLKCETFKCERSRQYS